jgi:hypothetical protein
VVSPDGNLLDAGDVSVELFCQLEDSSIVVESSHGCEILFGDILGVMRANQGVCIGWVSNDDDFDVSGGIVINGLEISEEIVRIPFPSQ